MAGGGICDKKPVRLGSGDKLAEGLFPVRAARQNDVVGEGVDMPVACEHV